MKQVSCVAVSDDAAQAVRVDEVPEPGCPDEGVVVQVQARPINPADLLLLNGRHVYSPALPAPVGIEGASGWRCATTGCCRSPRGSTSSRPPCSASTRRDGRAEAELRALGASAVLVDSDERAARVAAVAPSPVVRALDAVAGAASGRMYDCVGDGGELVVYELLASDVVQLPAARLVFRDVTVRGSSRLRVDARMTPARRAEITTELVALLHEGALHADVEARRPLPEVAAALRHQEAPGRRGRTLLG